MSDKKLFLLDGHALVYRAHYAFINRPLINSKGMNVSAVTGFTRSLWEVLQKQKPSHIAVAFDLSGPTFRHEMYEPYKANRDAQPEDITVALPYVKRMVEAFNIPIVTSEGFEADDVICTLAKQAEDEGFEVFMMTPDKDYAQVVSDRIFLYKPGRKGGEVEIMGVPEVLEKWNITKVSQVIDMLGLQGDSVDNIPGVPGIGPKTASKFLQEFDSIENLLKNTAQVKGKNRERLEEFAEQAILSKRLATIDCNVPIKFDAKTYVVEPFNRSALSELFKELEFRALAKAILGEGNSAGKAGEQGSLFAGTAASKKPGIGRPIPAHSVADHSIETVKHDYHLITGDKAIAGLVEKMKKEDSICFDTETTGLDANLAELVGLAFSWKAKEAYYVPVPADQEETKKIVSAFKPVLEDEKIEKVGQNLKYDILVLKKYGIEVKGQYFDTMIAHYLCEPDLRHKLDYLAESYLKYKMVPIQNLIGKKGKNQLSMRDIDVEKVKEYAGEDADLTWQLKGVFEPMLKENVSDKLFREIEMPLVDVLADMEHEGVRINREFLDNYSEVLGKQIAKREEEVYEIAGVKFNIASPRQVGEVLFTKMEIPYRWRKTSTGQYSTNEEILSELAGEHSVVSKILEFRKLSKLKSTYVDALPQLINPNTQRVHSSFNQARAATGRLSSEQPNLQNIPIRDEAGREIRKAFEPRDNDHILLAADYSQIELRLIAEISGDEAMLEAFQEGRDIHRATAARVYEVPYDEVSADQRRNAKTVNFSIIYGAGATNLSRQLGIPRTEAKELIGQYFRQYHGLKNYMDKTVDFARENGYVVTLLGRRRYLRDINSRNSLARSNSERIAINTPIQGTAADMIKVAMINIHQQLKQGNYKTRMILQVHDELVFDVYRSELEELKPIIEDKMRQAIPNLKVPILVGMGTGENWLEAH